jgi:hypothetical protein
MSTETPLAFTIKTFCKAHELSPSAYFAMQAAGAGPRTMRVGRTGVRITAEAAREWRATMEAKAAAETQSAAA